MTFNTLFAKTWLFNKVAMASLIATLVVFWPDRTLSAQELAREATWQSPSIEQVAVLVNDWGKLAGVDSERTVSEVRSTVNQHEDGVLGASLEIIAELFPSTADAVASLSTRPSGSVDWLSTEGQAIINNPRLPETARLQLQLAAGRWFARHQRYDEALEQLTVLSTDDVVDPAALLFYQGLGQHRLLKIEDCTQTLNRLLENEESIPRRFATIARLMIVDISSLEDGSLDEIARLMDDIQRRQALHRSGTRVIDEEKRVIEKLDKMIEEVEEKMKQQQQQQAAAQSQGSAKPMQQSQNAAGKGSGDVNDREIAEGGSWGSLPPQKRAAALAEMAKDLPPHYREVIEEYFRQLAKEPMKK